MIKNQINRSLSEGTHIAHIVTVAKTDSFRNFVTDGPEKDREWVNPTLQIGIVFGSKEGTFVYRFSLKGFEKYDETAPDDRDLLDYGCKKSEGRGYLLAADKDGNFHRVESENNTSKAERIFADMLRSLGLKNELDAAETSEQEVDAAIEFLKGRIADRTEIQLVLKNKNGKVEYAYTKKVAEALVPAVEESDDMPMA